MATTSTSRHNITVTPTTSLDLPALAECELLAFSGADDAADRYAELYAPFRAPLARAGLAPRHWPDYNAVIRKRRAQMRGGVVRYFTARVLQDAQQEDDEGQIAGLVTLEPPQSRLQASRSGRKWTERVLDDYVYPAVDALSERMLGPGGVGWDVNFLKTAKGVQKEARDAFTSQRECYIMHVLFVHPRFQGHGVGHALLQHCIALADAERVPFYLEASSARSVTFYAAHGFAQTRTLEIHYRGEVVPLPVMVREHSNADSEVPPRPREEEAGLGVPSPPERRPSPGTLSPGWEVMRPGSSGGKSDESYVDVKPGVEER